LHILSASWYKYLKAKSLSLGLGMQDEQFLVLNVTDNNK
jgi:hypothetical protein